MVGHVLRFMPEYRQVHEWLTGGELGLVRTLYMSRMSGAAAGAWQGWILGHQFGALDAQIHDLDFLTWTVGEGQYVTSRGWRGSTGNWAHIESGLVYEEERWAVVESSFGVPPTYPFTMFLRVIGERGALEYHFQGESYAKPTARRLTLYPMQGRAQDRTPPPADPYTDQMHHFVASVRRGEPPSCGRAEDARTALELALAVQRSLDSGGQSVTLPTA
jgi:predicted dehydrogenase